MRVPAAGALAVLGALVGACNQPVAEVGVVPLPDGASTPSCEEDPPLQWSPSVITLQGGANVDNVEVVFVNRTTSAVVLSDLRVLEGAVASTLLRIKQADPGSLTQLTVPPRPTDGSGCFGTAKLVLEPTSPARGRRSGQLRGQSGLPSAPTVVIPITFG